MGKKELSGRTIWQDLSGAKAVVAEKNLYMAFKKEFEGSDFVLHEKPNHLKSIYAQVILELEVQEQIYNPPFDISLKDWGVSPDFAIENKSTKKIIFGEIKRQDGWVEGKDPSAGRGNAHERLCKLFTPGLLQVYRKRGNLGDEVLPFWVVFEGDITRDPKRVREITLWFDGYKDHFFMWRDTMSDDDLIKHFNENLKHLLL